MTKPSAVADVMTVGEFNRRINLLFEQDPEMQRARVQGEISDFKRYPSGHSYFTLKDDEAAVSCVLFRGSAGRVNFSPQSGMKVIAVGKPNVYDKTGRFQFIVSGMEQAGLGDLYLAFEQLKKKLAAEGLFAQERKLAIPYIPQRIVAITSEAGAVIRDIIHVLERRYPGFNLLLIPVPVQGKGAELQIAAAIRQANAENLGDVIIVGRGGGSLEDLQAFNEEIVARAIAESQIPVISAVGHETDYTIVDFVSDLRAPTPSAAAELAVPHKARLLERQEQLSSALELSVLRRLESERKRLRQLRERPVLMQAAEFVAPQRRQLDFLRQQLLSEMRRLPREARNQLLPLQHRLSRPLEQKHARESKKLELLSSRLVNIIRSRTATQRSLFERLLVSLDALSPLAILARGYNLTYTEDKQLISSVSEVTRGDTISVRLQDGSLLCDVREIILEAGK
ncbi:MAG: exodeoxyribonuclease VII large subunit [Eubacteriales bacterium]|nr:exodeoxyribonuclease VII large subunit [Eubacteriales bacterium]MDD4541642.1 exodeoxyribonuclease VII large subunit [Eubacteriales bacterium]